MEEKLLKQILDTLKRNPQGLTTTEIARATSINIMTASKYLAVLDALKKIEYRKIGMAKLFKLKASK